MHIRGTRNSNQALIAWQSN